MFLLTGAILSACCRFELSIQDSKKIVRISINFCIPEFDQITIEKLIKFARNSMQNSCHSWSSLLKVRYKFWFLRFFGLRSSTFSIWCSTDAPGTLSGHPRSVPGTLQAVPGHYLGALGLPRRVPGPTSGRCWVPRRQKLLQISSKFRRKCDHISTEIRSKIGQKFIKIGSRFDQNSTLIKNLDRNC